ncbi:MAG: FAD-binding oxidoreductase [Inquilinus sp.]|nr:FAD-binding oxidoreductase [Inquilinus sp.]
MPNGRPKSVIVIGAGIVGVSAAIWLARAGASVTLVDRNAPGTGTSYGNAGVLAACSVVPVTTPGLIAKGPKLLLDPNFPLFLRWRYLPRLAPWLVRYLSHANDADTRRIAAGLAPIVSDTVEQHQALTEGTDAADWVVGSDYVFAYADRAAFEADRYVWALRKNAGFEPDLIEGDGVHDYEPALGPSVGLLARMRDHGFVRDPGGYVQSLARVFEREGGRIKQAEVRDIRLSDGRVTGVETETGLDECDTAVLTTGVWSKPLADKLGLSVPLETERGYHIVLKDPSIRLRAPTMVASGKFVATSMDGGLRCAGVVEFGGLEAGPSDAPLALLRKQVGETFPTLEFDGVENWLGHRPAPADSLPLIGEIGNTGVIAGFGHHHIGLTGGPKTGRLIADLITANGTNLDLAPYNPGRFRQH